jgi:hypothetical protein
MGDARQAAGTKIAAWELAASERHFNGTLEVDISSMRQQVIHALKTATYALTTSEGL